MRTRCIQLLAIGTVALSLGSFGGEKSLVAPAHAQTAPIARDSIRSWLPQGTVQVTILALVSPPRLQQLTGRFQAAVQDEPEWWLDYVRANAQPGEPLPHHPKMGVSEAEYEELLTLTEQVRLAPVSEAELTVRWEESGVAVFDGGVDLPELTGIEIDLDRHVVRTPFGVTTTSSRIQASEGQRATGPWSGVSWKREEMDDSASNGTLINFNLGRLQESGRGILYYDARRIADGALTSRVTRVLTYELPPE